ncbi:MAG TPA: hypothetical protein VIY56_06870 [Vicinamibacterales bacterium]
MPRCAESTCGRWRPSLGTRVLSGTQLNGQWYCSPACIEVAVRRGIGNADMPVGSADARTTLRLGAILRHDGAISRAQLSEALVTQRRSGLRLGAELQRLGYVVPQVVVRALAAQCGLSFLTTVDLARIRRAPGGLSGHLVRALGLVPFEADAGRRRLHVICTAPPPRAAFRALVAQTGWTAEPYLVDDALWTTALAAYPAGHQPERGWEAPLGDLGALADYVSRTAVARGAVTMRRAACPGVLWVRLEADSCVQDLLVSTPLEEPCLAASTLH